MRSRTCSVIAAMLFAYATTSALAQTSALRGGPNGAVRTDKGAAPEGMMVQLISKTTGIRTTVYIHKDGRYEFPKLATGSYVLRIALPREYRPYVKEPVQINGATKLADIVLQPLSDDGVLPQTPELLGQLTGSELIASHTGTPAVKQLIDYNCSGCHSFQQIFRNRFDKESWTKIVFRMTHGAGSPLININPRGRFPEAEEAMVNWLSEVRAPNAKIPTILLDPRPTGKSTEAVVTEYELPRLEIATHDVAGDATGGLWYSAHRSSYFGRLDPKTGIVKQYYNPSTTPGGAPGLHWIHPDDKGNVWAAENWSHNMIKFNIATGALTKVPWYASVPVNNPMGGNYSMDPEGYIWLCRDGNVMRLNAETGAIVKKYPTKKFRQTYGSAMSKDGRYFGGGAWPSDGMVIVDTKTGEVFEPETSKPSGPKRGSFDDDDNYWSGARNKMLVKFDTKTHTAHEYKAPTTYGSLYTAKADKNGEVWTGGLQSGRYFRFNPKNEQWTPYLLPEPYGHDRESWIDNSTNPVSVYYVDHEGYITRFQPLE